MHVIGDMIQSIGVIIAAALIYVWPEYKIADPICTYLFSILVIITTIPVFKDCVRILMESVPKGIEPEKLRKSILSVQGVTQVTDIHVWALGGNKNVLTAHITVAQPKDEEITRVHAAVTKKLQGQNICHMTLQIL